MVTLDSIVCYDPRKFANECQQSDPPLPTDWYRKVNTYVNVVGMTPGSGAVLVRQEDLNKLLQIPNTKRTLKFGDVTLRNIRIVGNPRSLTSGAVGDGKAIYLVELTDRKIDAEGVTVSRYNWRYPNPTSSYDTNSLRSGVAWTWTQLIEDLWNQVGCLGTYPGLPSAISSTLATDTPVQIDCHGFRVADALEDVLALNGMAVCYDPVNDKFTIEYLADSGNAYKAFHQRWKSRQLWNDERIQGSADNIPAYGRVLFPVWSEETGGDNRRVYAVDVASGLTGTTENSYCLIQDYIPCRVNSSASVQNTSDLVARAAVAAKVFFDRFKPSTAQDAVNIAYGGWYNDPALLGSPTLDAVAWMDVGDGPVTSVFRCARSGVLPLFDFGASSPQTSGTMLTTLNGTELRQGSNSDEKDPLIRFGLPETGMESRMLRLGERP